MSAVAALPFQPAAVLFDMDGLMLDSERAFTDCLAQAAREQAHRLPQSLWLQMVGGSDAHSRALLEARIGKPGSDAVQARARTLYDAVVDAGVPHRPGIVPLLRWLVAARVPRAVGTSTRNPLALRKLQAAGLLSYFDAVCTSSDVEHPKPAPDVYLLAAQRLGVAPAHCVVLEDSPPGVRAALAAGMTPVQVPDLLAPDAATRALGHRIVASLDEVQALLRACW
ncbi:HAD family hydrolase [Thermomonas sp.]|uniref:HAD family hydrolase n=1 Tax=Thermomonas sp. TaxID=1971895 RepID=UPI0035AF7C57